MGVLYIYWVLGQIQTCSSH